MSNTASVQKPISMPFQRFVSLVGNVPMTPNRKPCRGRCEGRRAGEQPGATLVGGMSTAITRLAQIHHGGRTHVSQSSQGFSRQVSCLAMSYNLVEMLELDGNCKYFSQRSDQSA